MLIGEEDDGARNDDGKDGYDAGQGMRYDGRNEGWNIAGIVKKMLS